MSDGEKQATAPEEEKQNESKNKRRKIKTDAQTESQR